MAELYHSSIYKADSHVDSCSAACAGLEVEGWGPLSSDARCEVAVIGGGSTGMETALHLACDYNVNGSHDRLCLIYNADFNNETRTFDFVAQPGGGASLTSQRWSTAGTFVATGSSILGALEPQSANAAVTPDQMNGLVTALDASDFYGSPPVGTTLRSDDDFWSSVACLDGQFMVQAYPRDRLDRVAFTQALKALDPIGRPLPPVVLKSLPPLNSVGQQGRNRGVRQGGSELYYSAAVGEDSITARWIN
ncbi:MAG: hypothetical protein GDA49_13945 [Rhodospirillales bacterium]|nr:hypothetical protein [Rhodospirillales bacterium]